MHARGRFKPSVSYCLEGTLLPILTVRFAFHSTLPLDPLKELLSPFPPSSQSFLYSFQCELGVVSGPSPIFSQSLGLV
jgi:hypothetical protein